MGIVAVGTIFLQRIRIPAPSLKKYTVTLQTSVTVAMNARINAQWIFKRKLHG